MIKTNTRRRVVSVLLALVMLVSLMPSLVVPAHAFWDDYDDGFDCPNCDHYHFGSDYMCDCLFMRMDTALNVQNDFFIIYHCLFELKQLPKYPRQSPLQR